MTEEAGRIVVISSDAHAGADLLDYRPYLEGRWQHDFDEWAEGFRNPFESEHLLTNDPSCNWDSDGRRRLLDGQGVVGEVVFPNTVPPFFPQTQFFVPPPARDREEYERRWAGLQAHNRWMVDFCNDLPGRRAGVAQIMLEDVDDAVAEIEWVRAAGLTGGVLVPGVPPGAELEPLYSRRYDPIWAACADLGVPVNFHSGGGLPHYPDDPVAMAVLLKEVTWFANRNLAHLVLGGVFDRHPDLRACFTEQGASWVVSELAALDSIVLMMEEGDSAQHFFGGPELLANLTMLPSEHFARSCFVGASPLRRDEAEVSEQIGVDRIMWGNDFPHIEGTFPHSIAAIRYAMAHLPAGDVEAMVGGNAARVYDFDEAALTAAAREVGPTLAELCTPLPEVPAGSLSSVFIAPLVAAKRAARAGRP